MPLLPKIVANNATNQIYKKMYIEVKKLQLYDSGWSAFGLKVVKFLVEFWGNAFGLINEADIIRVFVEVM